MCTPMQGLPCKTSPFLLVAVPRAPGPQEWEHRNHMAFISKKRMTRWYTFEGLAKNFQGMRIRYTFCLVGYLPSCSVTLITERPWHSYLVHHFWQVLSTVFSETSRTQVNRPGIELQALCTIVDTSSSCAHSTELMWPSWWQRTASYSKMRCLSGLILPHHAGSLCRGTG